MNDVRLLLEMRAWLQGEEFALPDAESAAREIAELLPRTRQKRCRRPLLSVIHRRNESLTAADTVEYEPSPIPAGNGHTPTVIGRTHSMLSPLKTITAGALVMAIGGAFLIGQPFARQGSAPGAITDDPAMAPSFFSGTTANWTDATPPVTERRDDGIVVAIGESQSFDWVANDPRISGRATMVLSETDYRQGASALVPTEEIGTIRTVLMRIVNDGGSWEGPLTWLAVENPEAVNASGWLTGTDAYEGLGAYVVWSYMTSTGRDLYGHITAEGPPPTPGGLPE